MDLLLTQALILILILLLILLLLITSGQSTLTLGRIAPAHGRFNRIRQVAPMCTPHIESQKKMVVMATSLTTLQPWQRHSALLEPHHTHDSYGPSEPTTQTASRSVQPFLHR